MAQVEGHILRYAEHVHFAYVLHGGATDKIFAHSQHEMERGKGSRRMDAHERLRIA